MSVSRSVTGMGTDDAKGGGIVVDNHVFTLRAES